MKLNPQQAPLYGDSVLTVLLTEEDKLEDDVVFYLLFAGSTLKHLTSTKKVDSVTLKTVTPGHDCCETVKVSLCASKKDLPVLVVAEETFQFVQDEAYDAAQFLAASAGNQQALIFARFLDRSRPPLEDVSILDEKVTLAFRHLKLPEEWNVLGSGKNINDDAPQETLMHFAVRLGLLRLAWLLLQQPGGRESLGIHNNEGATPVSLALERGFQKLHQLLTDEKVGEPDAWSTLSRVISPGDPCIKHHRGLNVYTLTDSHREGAHSSLDDDIGELRKHIQRHSQPTNATMQADPEPGIDPNATILKERVEQNLVTADAQSKVPNLIEVEAVVLDTLSAVGITAHTVSGGNGDAQFENPLEPKTLDNPLSVVAAEVLELSCDSINKDSEAEKEEVGRTLIVGSEKATDKCDRAERSPVALNGVEILPSCGKSSAEADRALPGIISTQRDLCDIDSTYQEVKPTSEGASVSVGAEDAADPIHANKEIVADMGQAESNERVESLDGGQQLDCVQANKEDSCSVVADSLDVPECQEEPPVSSIVELAGDLVARLLDSEMSGSVDQNQEPLVHEIGDLAPMAVSGITKNEADVDGKVIETEETDSLISDLASVELSVQESPQVECNEKHVPAAIGVQTTDGETPVKGENMVADVKTDLCGEHIVLAEVECMAPELTEPCHEEHESASVRHETDIQTESVAPESKPDIQCLPLHGGDNTVTGNSRKEAEGSFSKFETTSGSDASCFEKQETVDCNSGVLPAANELSTLINLDGSIARDRVHELEGISELPVLTAEEQQLLQKQTVSLCDSGTEQELPCLPRDLSLEPSASDFVQPEVAQEMEPGFVFFLAEDPQKPNAESHAAAPPAGEEAPLHSEDEVSTSNKSKHVQQDGLMDTPCGLPNNPCEVNQEVDIQAADFTEQGSARIENALSAACQDEKALQEESHVLPAVSEGAQPKQVLCESGAPRSDMLSSLTGLESPAPIQGPEQCVNRGASPDIGLEQAFSNQETDSGLAEDAKEGAQHDVIESTTDVLQAAGDDSPQTSSSEEEGSQVESLDCIATCDVLPESTAALVDGDGACEEVNGVDLVDNTEEEEEDDESESVTISRASLHPIAEEPLSDSDYSPDMTSSSSDSSPIVKEFPCHLLKADDDMEDKINKIENALLPPSESTPEFSLPLGENASVVSFVKDLIGSVEAEDSINTTGTLTSLEPGLELSGDCVTATSTADLPSPKEDLQSTSLSEPISPGILASSPTCEGDSGLELSEQIDDDLTSPGGDELTILSESLDMKCQDEVDFAAGLQILPERGHLINRDSWCSIEPCPGPQLLQPKQTIDSTECESFLEDGLGSESTSSQRDFPRNSGSDSDIFHLSGEGMDDMVFTKGEEEQSVGDITSSSSSADDTTSLERTSSRGSDISLPRTFHGKKHKNRHSVDSSCSSTTTAAAEGRENGEPEPTETEGEEMDSITEVPPQASLSRHSMRSLSPFRRHSWGPGKNTGSDTEINQRSSMRILGDVVRKSSNHRRSMSWCPSGAHCISMGGEFNYRSYSLEGLAGDGNDKNLSQTSEPVSLSSKELSQPPPTSGDDCSSFLYLSKGETEAKQRESRASERLERSRMQTRGLSYSTSALSPPLTKSMSLVTIHQPGLESTRSLNSTSSSLAHSISEESCNPQPPSPSRKDLELKGGTKVSRTFSYIKNKMSSKKTKEKEKDKDKTKEKDKDCKEKDKDKKTLNGHHFTSTPIVGPLNCQNCVKLVSCKDAYLCSYCNSIVHKGCRESYTSCAMVKMKQTKVLQAHDTSSLPTVIMRNKNSQPKERPRSAIVAADETAFTMLYSSSRRPQTTLSLSKSVSIQNIAGAGNDENHLNTNKYLSRSTDSLNKMNSKVTESMESLNDEGTDMNEGQLMGDFEMDSKQLEAESWSQAVDSKFLRQQKKDVVKRQDVIYELMQTEMHHVRTLKIMSDVYSRGMATELQFEPHMVEKIFPCLDDLLKIHNQFFQNILDRRRESMVESSDKNFVIKRIGDLLVNQFSGENAERMKKTYGKFCGHHNEAVNYFKDLHAKEKRFQAFMKKKMSSSVVRRLGIPECILLVTQRITKYPVLLQRILQYTKENEVEHVDVAQSLILVKDVITAVNSKVNNYEKKMRLHEIYSRTDSKSIQRMKGGKMFAKEDLKRRKLVRDGSVFLKTAASRLKEVQAVLLADTLVFLQEKDQKYVFASLEQKSTVISLKRLIVRDVAHEEKGLFLISMGEKDPEMVEVHASSKDERNSWMQVIQDTMNTMGKDEDEGVPSESEEERKILDTKAKELKEQLQQKDKQILTLLDEKENIFRNLCSGQDDGAQDLISRGLFRASAEALKGEELVKTAIKEVETLQGMVSSNLGGTLGSQVSSPTEPGVVGPVSLPRRAETFGGFDSHQMTTLKNGEKDEVDENLDLRRTESDGVLKKGGNANFMLLLKRNSEQVLCSVSHLHELLSTLQAVVLQQDSYIEDQKMVLNERTISRTLSKPNSLIEQEKQRSLEKQRQELANLQKQQAQHLEEKRKREREWEARERELNEREARLVQREELASKGLQDLEKERDVLQARKEEYQRDLERLRTAQKQLEKETEQLKRDMEQDSNQHDKIARTSSMATESCKQPSSSSPKHEHLEPVSPKKEGLFRTDSKQKSKGPFHLLSTTNQTNKPTDRLFNLSKPKEKKEKKKKNKGGRSDPSDCPPPETGPESEEIFC